MRPLVLLLLFTSLFILAGCADKNSKIRGEFLSGCLQGGTSKSVCKCVFGKLKETYTDEEFTQLASTYRPDKRFLNTVKLFGEQCRID